MMKAITSNIGLSLLLGFFINLMVMGQMEKINPTTNSIGTEQGILKSVQNSYPCEVNHYFWDVTTIWMPDYNMYKTYDTHGNIMTEMQANANTGDTTERYVYTYDSQQRLTKEVYQLWNNGNWVNAEQYYFEFDDQDNPTIWLHQIWQGGNWVANNGAKYIYTYDINNNITEKIFQNWDNMNTTWKNSMKYIYTYDLNGYLTERVYQTWDDIFNVWASMYKEIHTVSGSGVVNETIYQSWDNPNSTWVNQEKHANILWHEWSGDVYESQIQSYTSLQWNSGIWENWYRETITYDAYGGSVNLMENYFNGNWMNATKETLTYDEHAYLTGDKVEFWTNNVWVIDHGFKNLLTYNNNDLVQKINQNWDQFAQQWANSYKEEYSDFVNIGGINSIPLQQAGLLLYPNPTSGIVNLEMNAPDEEIISVTVMNATGQVVYDQRISTTGSPEYKIDLVGCSKGIYFVKIDYARGTVTGKLIIR